MLPHGTFLPHEPRAVYPVFADCDNRLSYVLRETYIPTPAAALRHCAGRVLRGERRWTSRFLTRVLLDSLRGIRVNFRGAYLDRDGRLLGCVPNFACVQYRQGFDISVNSLIAAAGLPLQDGQFLLIADRGVKLDGGYSIGTVTAAYVSATGFSCYRNAAFARPINEFGHHRPTGFRSIAPHMVCGDDAEASAYFFNFSSDTSYSLTANPRVTLRREDGSDLQAMFGGIPPFGARERSISDLFGAEGREFLARAGGYGTLIAEQDGVTLGSLHLIRNRRNGGLGIEHTRPTHMYVL